MISTVDPRRATGTRPPRCGFDGYKGHVAIDPDSEIITATEVTPGNASDGSVANILLVDVLKPTPSNESPAALVPISSDVDETATSSVETAKGETAPTRVEIYGDASYGTTEIVDKIEAAGAEANVKVQAPSAPAGHFGKDAFRIDLDAQTVKCPASVLVQIRKHTSTDGGGVANFAAACTTCVLRAKCTDAKAGRAIRINPKDATLQRSRARPDFGGVEENYRATRPKVEHQARAPDAPRTWRSACSRPRFGAHPSGLRVLAAAHSLARLAKLGVRRGETASVSS